MSNPVEGQNEGLVVWSRSYGTVTDPRVPGPGFSCREGGQLLMPCGTKK